MRCEEAMKIIEVLRLSEQGYSQREIAAGVNCSKSTVGEVQKRCRAASIGYEQAKGMGDDELRAKLYPRAGGRPEKAEPEWVSIQKKLDSSKRITLQYVWEEYRIAYPDGLCRSQFCERYRKWRQQSGREVVMVQEREPGKELFVDWMGDRPALVVDSETGKMLKAHFFVGALGDSGYPIVEACADEKIESWLMAHVHAFRKLGGLPQIVEPDNCKTAVNKAQYYDPQINQAYQDMASYYQVAVIPARVRRPQDKAIVEQTVGWLERWLVPWLEDEVKTRGAYQSFAELNSAVSVRMRELVKRPFEKRAGSRESVFLALDKPALRPLPPSDYEPAVFVSRKVPDNYHLEYGGFYYSVPYTYYRQEVTMKVTYSMIEVYDKDRKRIAIHERRRTGKRYVTILSHMPSNHQAQVEKKGFDGARYRSWAGAIGPSTFQMIDTLLKQAQVEQSAYRSCMGILQYARRYGNPRLEAACSRAALLQSFSYTTVRNILKNKQENSPLPLDARARQSVAEQLAVSSLQTHSAHENLRGAAAFR